MTQPSTLQKILHSAYFWFGAVVIALLLLYIPRLTHYTISGDDLYLIAGAPESLPAFLSKVTDFSGQYRPLTHALFSVHRALLPNVTSIFALHYSLLFVMAALIFANLLRISRPVIAVLLTVTTLMSPIFYYHFFSVSALNNILMLIFLFASLLLVDLNNGKKQTFFDRLDVRTKVATAFALLILAMLSKENFLVNTLVFYIILWQHLSKKHFLVGAFFTSLLTGVYFVLHFTQYTPPDSEYALGNSALSIKNIVLDISAWMLGYPRGWQYGAADPKTWLTYLTTFITFFAFSTIFIPVKKFMVQWKTQALFMLALGLSLVPFVLIQRVLPFYLDITLLIVVFWVIYNHQEKTTLQIFFSLLVGLSFILQFILYYPQWHKYSFVADANTAIHHYQKALTQSSYLKYEVICITNNSRGSWATKDGDAARMLYSFQGNIISSKEDSVPEDCRGEHVLLLRNDGWDFKKL